MANLDKIIESVNGAIKIVKYNKPYRKNAIDYEMYTRIIDIFDEAKNNDDINVLVLTGSGDFYSSGNDMIDSMKTPEPNFHLIKRFIDAFITFPKMLIAIVNGPAIGIASTTLAFCDLVFAAENSYFSTPFIKYGFVPEGCSSIMFPRILGDRKAVEILLLGYKMSAKEAFQRGFVNYVYKPDELEKVWDRIVDVSNLPCSTLTASKKLIRAPIKKELLKTNEQEIEELSRLWKMRSKI